MTVVLLREMAFVTMVHSVRGPPFVRKELIVRIVVLGSMVFQDAPMNVASPATIDVMMAVTVVLDSALANTGQTAVIAAFEIPLIRRRGCLVLLTEAVAIRAPLVQRMVFVMMVALVPFPSNVNSVPIAVIVDHVSVMPHRITRLWGSP